MLTMDGRQTIGYYDNNAEEFISGTISLDVTELYKPFLELIPRGGRILDAGCGSGRDSLYFMQQDYKVTAFDASAVLAASSSELIGQQALHLTFEEIGFAAEFDGVWACASLLHVSESRMDSALAKLTAALKPGGVLYASFKYGSRDEHRNGRLFCDYDEARFSRLLQRHQSLHSIKLWLTKDVRTERQRERWLNVLLRRI